MPVDSLAICKVPRLQERYRWAHVLSPLARGGDKSVASHEEWMLIHVRPACREKAELHFSWPGQVSQCHPGDGRSFVMGAAQNINAQVKVFTKNGKS